MPPRTLADGRYEILDSLGEGGMAAVYRAIDHRLEVERAIKILAPRYVKSRQLRERFHREARLMARLEHPNIVGVHDVGEIDGSTYIVMSLHMQGSVHDHLKRFGAMPPAQAVAVTRDVLKALVAAHRIGVVHRDIKPHNVLVDEHGSARLADFGIAHSTTDQTLTRTGALMGTWAYMAPEQRNSAKSTDQRSDLYAVGAMLMNLVRDAEPHDLHNAESHAEQLEGIPEPLADFIRTCTRYRPEERFQTAQDALDALEVLEIPAAPPDTPALGSGWIAPGELPPSTAKETHDTLLAYLSDDPTVPTPAAGAQTGVTSVPADDEPPPQPANGIDPNAPTVLGQSTRLLDGPERAIAVPDEPSSGEAAPAPPTPNPSSGPNWPLLGGLGLLLLVGVGLIAGSQALTGPPPEPPVPTTPTEPETVSRPAPLPEPAEPEPVVPDPAPLTPPQPIPSPSPVPDPAPVEPAVPEPAPLQPEPVEPEPAEPEPAEPEPAEPAGPTVRLMAISIPESEIFVDGQSQGRGRIRAQLPPGRHTLRFVPDDGDPIVRPVDLEVGSPLSYCWDFDADAVCSKH